MSVPDPNASLQDSAADAPPVADPAAPVVEAPVNVVAPDPLAAPAGDIENDGDAQNPVDPAGTPGGDPNSADDAAAPVVPPITFTAPLAASDPQPVDSSGTPIVPPVDVTQAQQDAATATLADALVATSPPVDPALQDTPEEDVPFVSPADHPDVLPATEIPTAASLVLDNAATPDPVEVVPSRSEVTAQQLIDEGAPALETGAPVAPTETSDLHTVDPSGTADDGQPGIVPTNSQNNADPTSSVSTTPGTDVNTASIDQRIATADRNKGVSNVDPDSATFVLVALIEAFAEQGVHSDLLHAAVDKAYANLSGQRNSAATAGQPDPFPLYVG